MPNYRGEERASSKYGDQLARQYEAGTSNSQRRRDLLQKIALGAIQAGLVGAAGVYGHVQSKDAQEVASRPAKGVREAALGNIYKNAGKQNPNWERDRAENKLFRGETTAIPDYKPMTGGSEYQPQTGLPMNRPDYVEKLAKTTLKDLDSVVAGGQAPVHGRDGSPYWNRESFDKANDTAEMHGRDINTARDMMSSGGGDVPGAWPMNMSFAGENIYGNRGTGLSGSFRGR